MRRILHYVMRAGVFFFAILAILVLAELGLRAYGIVPSGDRMVGYQFDETIGWKTRPDFKQYRSSLYYGHFNYYDAAGFPSDSANQHTSKSTTTPSIAFVGSSFAESYYVPYDQSFPELVDEAIPEKQVLNLGVSGYSPAQYLLRAREELPKYETSDIVVIFFPYKDLPGLQDANYQGYMKPYFALGGTLDTPANLPLILPPESAVPTGGFANAVRSTSLYTFLRPYIRKSVNVGLIEDTKTAGVYDPALMDEALRIFEAIGKEHPKARLIVYHIPYYKELDDAELYKKNLAVYFDACKERSLECFSMDDVIKTHPRKAEIFIIGDGHVTAFGAKLIARSLVAALTNAR